MWVVLLVIPSVFVKTCLSVSQQAVHPSLNSVGDESDASAAQVQVKDAGEIDGMPRKRRHLDGRHVHEGPVSVTIGANTNMLAVDGDTSFLEPKGSMMRREHQAVNEAEATSRHRRDRKVPVPRSEAPGRIPARRTVRRAPIQATSVGHNPTPPLWSAKRPPWSPLPQRLHAVQSPTPQRIREAFEAGEASLDELGRARAKRFKTKFGASGGKGCNPSVQDCCNPDDPPKVYEECQQNNREEAEAQMALPACDKACSSNCCCFFASGARTILLIGAMIKSMLMRVSIKAVAHGQSMGNYFLAEAPMPSNGNPEADADEQRKYIKDVIQMVLRWWMGSLVVCYMIVRVHEVGKASYRYISNKARYLKEKSAGLTTDPGDPRRALDFCKKYEADRLGNVTASLVIELKTINRNLWHLVNFFSLGLFYWIMKKPKQVSLMVLGSSGRLLIINTTPMTSMKKAFQLFTALGINILAIYTIWIVALRCSEQTFIQAKKSPDPDVRRQAKASKDFISYVEGHVHLFGLAGFLFLWIVHLIVLKISLRPWASGDQRDYYQASEANCVQYFRGGHRPPCPCAKRRRKGAFRFFFGPYPEPELWHGQGKGFEGTFLDSLEPLVAMPVDRDPGIPPAGNGGKAQTEEQEFALMQSFLGFMQWFLGALGLFCFALHLINLTQNVELCPSAHMIRKCVTHGDCTRYVQTGWFQMYMERGGYMSAQEAAQKALQGPVKLAHIAMWLRLPSVEEAKDAVVMIAKKSCLDRRQELIESPVKARNPKSVDTLGSFNAANYNALRTALRLDIAWDGQRLNCVKCRDATALHYFSNFENSAEVVEVLLLSVSCYVSALLVKMSMKKKSNAPLGDMVFESDPSSAMDIPVEKVEKAALHMLAKVFDYRYQGGNLPVQAANLEKKMRYAYSQGFDSTLLADPWQFDDSSTSWDNYDLTSSTNARRFMVSKKLLGILPGEEVLSAWSETPRLTLQQKAWLIGGIFIMFLLPCIHGAFIGMPKCFAEGIVGGGCHLFLFHYFVLKRRPQSGFVLTTRRVFQLSRIPAYRDLCGKNEPLLKIDVLVHNAGITFLTGMFEGTLSLTKRAMVACCNSSVWRSGSVVAFGGNGTFQLWRDLGDTRETILAFSRCAYAEKMEGLSPTWGLSKMQDEAKVGAQKPKDPCYPCILCCCPSTPVPPGAETDLLSRYCMKFDKEQQVYGRLLTIRPAGCLDLCCGQGFFRIALEPCPCCILEEGVTDFIVTTHRTLVEQRMNMRYCRQLCYCLRKTPNIRVTFIANYTTTAYVVEKPSFPYGCAAVRQDLLIKILPSYNREYPAGLVLRQQPYAILSGRNSNPEDSMWVKHISECLDKITESDSMKELEASSSEGSDAEGYAEDYDAGKGKAKAKAKGKAKKPY